MWVRAAVRLVVNCSTPFTLLHSPPHLRSLMHAMAATLTTQRLSHCEWWLLTWWSEHCDYCWWTMTTGALNHESPCCQTYSYSHHCPHILCCQHQHTLLHCHRNWQSKASEKYQCKQVCVACHSHHRHQSFLCCCDSSLEQLAGSSPFFWLH